MAHLSLIPIVLLAQILHPAPSSARLSENHIVQPESKIERPADNYTTDAATRKAIDKRIAAVKSANTFRDGFVDDKGDLWFSSNSKGIYRYDGESFTNITTKDGLSDNQVTSIMQDSEGNMWFGMPDGMCRYDGENFAHIQIPHVRISSSWLDKAYPVVNPNQVTDMLQDRNGNFWIGTNGFGAYHYDGENFTSHLANHGLIQTDGLYHNVVLELTQDTKGNIWFTSLTRGGISRYDGTSMKHFTVEDGLSDYTTRSIHADRSGNVWIGSNGNQKGGLDRFDGETFTNFHSTHGTSSTSISAIFEDSTGNLWIGIVNGDLCTFDGKQFVTIIDQDGTTFQAINFIIEDHDSNIWFGGNHGQLYRYDGKDISDFSHAGK